METFSPLMQQAIFEEAEARRKAIEFVESAKGQLEAAMDILAGRSTETRVSPVMPRSTNGRGKKAQYVDRFIQMLDKMGKLSMSPSEAVPHMREMFEKDGLANMKRESLEHAFFMEMRKPSPRLRKMGNGQYGAAHRKKSHAA